MADEVIGGVKVTVGADYAPMVADFAAAQGVAAKAGTGVASAFSAGASTATPAIDSVGAAVAELSAAQTGLAVSTEEANAALGHQVSQLQATSGAIRVALGEQSIRAAERFLSIIPGIGTALQYAFPVIGAIALTEAVSRVADKATGLKAAEDELARSTREADDAFGHMVSTIDQINVERITRELGAAAGQKSKALMLGAEARDASQEIEGLRNKIKLLAEDSASIANHPILLVPHFGGQFADAAGKQIQAIGEQIDALNAKIIERSKQSDAALEESQQTRVKDAGQLSAARISAEESQNTRLVEMAKLTADQDIAATHRSVAAGIAAMHDREAAAVATAEEEVRVAKETADRTEAINRAARDRSIVTIQQKAGAESAGKTPTEAADIQIKAQGEIAAARDAYDKQQIESAGRVAEAEGKLADAQAERARKTAEVQASEWEKSYDAITKAAKETSDAQARAVEKQIETNARVDEIQERGAGNVRSIGAGAQKVQLEAQYGAQVSHTRQQEIAYLTRIAALENQINSAKLVGLAEAQQEAEAAGDRVKAAELQVQLNEEAARLHAQAANSQAQTAATLQRQSLGSQLGATAQQGVGQLSNALAKGIVDGGKGLGKDIRQSLAGIGKEMLGDILKQSMEQLVIAITGNTIATNINTLWTQIQALAAKIPFFAGGTDSAPGGFAMVGEKGPEIVNLPRGSQVVPNHAIKRYADGVGYSSSSSSSQSFGDMHFHAHGMSNPDQFIDHVMRKLPNKLKARSSSFSPYSR